MSNENDIAQLITVLSAAYPNWNPSPFTAEVYFQDLKDIPADELKAASQHCRTSTNRDQRFAPSAGEIRKAVYELRQMKTNLPSAYEAWEEVRVFIRDNSYYITPQWSHPLIEKTVGVFGLDNLRQSENGTSDRMRFIEAYEQFSETAAKEGMLVPEVKHYIEDENVKRISAGIKQLAEGMRK